MKYYLCTLLRCDGSQAIVSVSKKKLGYSQMKDILGLNNSLEIVPGAYYKHQGWSWSLVYADDMGRFKKKPQDNLHFTMFPNGSFMPPVVGDCLRVSRTSTKKMRKLADRLAAKWGENEDVGMAENAALHSACEELGVDPCYFADVLAFSSNAQEGVPS